MNKKIIFQKCRFNNIYFLLYIIMLFIKVLIDYKIYPDKQELSKYYLQLKFINYLYTYNLSDFLAIIPLFIRKKLLKKKKNILTKIKDEDNKIKNDFPLVYTNNFILIADNKKKITIIYCIILGTCDFLKCFAKILYSIIYSGKEIDLYTFSCLVPLEIILQFICSYLILKTHFNKLQYFSLFLNFGIFIIILIIDIINISLYNSFDGKILYFYIAHIIFYSIEYSLGKKILLYGFISIYLLIIIKGCIVLIFGLLFSLVMFFVDRNIFLKFELFFSEKKYILLIIANIFSNFFVNLFLWLIIDRFSPNYLPFVFIFEEIIYLIADIIDNFEYNIMGWDLYIRIALYLISAIGVMIHNEIVVINICNLGSDTKYFIDKKVESEELFANTENIDIIKRYETIEMDSVDEENRDSIDNEGENSLYY